MSALSRTTSGDIALPLVIEHDLATLTAQKMQDELNLWQGEWFLDIGVGFPWVPRILGLRNPSITQIRALLRQAILETPGVVAVTDLQLGIISATQSLTYTFTAQLDNGFVATGGPGVPFVVTGDASS